MRCSTSMCSFVAVEMENYQGDLTDIIRGGGGRGGGGGQVGSSCTGSSSDHRIINSIDPSPNWDLQFASDHPLNFTCGAAMDDHRESVFGDPFSHMGDPLLHELNMSASHASAAYYSTPNSAVTASAATAANAGVEESAGFCQQKAVFEDDIKSPCHIFSRIQISSSSQSPKQLLPITPCDSPPVPVMSAAASSSSLRRIKAPAMLTSDMINASSSKNTACLLDNPAPAQISSPRNLGIKRRKSQAKKVVCIPAPAAANSRSSGEVVPSDLWAWRKYGQKPIKGSPYPRGYYRCSSSKGCSARKQVERSRTDPNMLVITYTSEHNHPWPTQRNSLAGSTRSQPSKNIASKNSPSSQTQNSTKESEVKENSSNDTLSPHVGGASSSASVKEEFEENINEKQFEMEDAHRHHHHHHQYHHQFSSSEGFSHIYKPALPDHDNIHSNNQSDQDFFADLGEIEADPLNLLFTQGFSTTGTGSNEQKESKALDDPFNLFDWSAGDDTHNNYNNNNSFGGEAKRGL